mgnify:CR=1 FL=1
MRPHEIREIVSIGGWTDKQKVFHPLWSVKFRRYGIVDAIDYIQVHGADELEAFNTATKRLETYR